MEDISDSLKNAVGQLANVLESSQNKYNRAMYDSQPPQIQKTILQNCYDNGMPAKKIAIMTGVPLSTVYSKIKAR